MDLYYGIIKIDGVSYKINVASLKRSFEVADSDASGRTMDWNMHRDVVGTFYNYELEIYPDYQEAESYNHLYEVISAPRESHLVELIYGDTTKAFRAYITKGTDELKMIRNGKAYWDKLTVSIIAMEPQRRA